jgi:hypothetical protein
LHFDFLPILGQGSDREACVGKGSAGPPSGLGVHLDAIRALGDMGNGNQLLRLGVESAGANTWRPNASNAAYMSGASSRRLCANSAESSG